MINDKECDYYVIIIVIIIITIIIIIILLLYDYYIFQQFKNLISINSFCKDHDNSARKV